METLLFAPINALWISLVVNEKQIHSHWKLHIFHYTKSHSSIVGITFELPLMSVKFMLQHTSAPHLVKNAHLTYRLNKRAPQESQYLVTFFPFTKTEYYPFYRSWVPSLWGSLLQWSAFCICDETPIFFTTARWLASLQSSMQPHNDLLLAMTIRDSKLAQFCSNETHRGYSIYAPSPFFSRVYHSP